MPTWLATTIGWASLLWVPWSVIAAGAPGSAVRLWPGRLRARCADDRFWRALVLSTGVVSFAAGAAIGVALARTPDDPSVQHPNAFVTACMCAVLFGGLGTWGTARVASVAARHARYADSGPGPIQLAPSAAAVELRGDRPPLPVVARDRRAHRAHRLARRVRAVALVGIPVAYVLARAEQVVAGDDEPWTLRLAALWVVLIAVAAGCTWLLRAGRKETDTGLRLAAQQHGWTYHPHDQDRLDRRFPYARLLRASEKGAVVSARTVDARTGAWQWWMTEQRGEVRANRSAPLRTVQQTTWLVWLPSTQLPSLRVYGRDDAAALEWAGTSLGFELEAFNRAWYVRHGPNHAAYAHAVMHPRLIELVTKAMPDGSRLTLHGDVATLTREGRLPRGELVDHAAFLLAFVNLLPTHVLLEHTAGTARGLPRD